MSDNQQFRYQPEIFNQSDWVKAQTIVLSPENGIETEKRWVTETPWLLSILKKALPDSQFFALDFGCGVGRMSKALVEAGHTVLGVDISAEMRQHAIQQNPERFSAVSIDFFDRLVQSGTCFDLALSVWVLQHCPNLDLELDRLSKALRPGGVFFVVDMNHRAIPTDHGWVHDGRSVFDEVIKRFELIQKLPYQFEGAPENLRNNAWLGFFRKTS